MTVVNLNKFRKAKARAEKKVQADENAVKFGRTKAEKAAQQSERDRASKGLDGAKREQ